MTIQVSLATDRIGVIYTSSGVLTGRDLLWAHGRLQDELQSNSGIRYVLVDHSAVSDERGDTESLKQLAERTAPVLDQIEQGLVAIVAPNDVLFGLSRMWTAMAEDERMEVFVTRDRDDALRWLSEELGRRELPFQLTS